MLTGLVMSSGAGPNILTHTWSTKVPLNINDSDLFPDMKEEPKPVATASEMIFVLQRIEIAQCLKGLRSVPPPENPTLSPPKNNTKIRSRLARKS